MGEKGEFTLTPEDAYRLTAAAIDLVASVSANVHASLRHNPNATRPMVNGPALLALADVLNGLVPGFPMADLAIQDVDERRRGRAARTRDLRGSKSGGEVATGDA